LGERERCCEEVKEGKLKRKVIKKSGEERKKKRSINREVGTN
jgi:hypothetical protein